MSEFLEIGFVIAAHGLRGTLKIRLHPGSSSDVLCVKWIQLVLPDHAPERFEVLTMTPIPRGCVLANLRGIENRNDAEPFRGARVEVHRNDLPALEEGELYLTDLVGVSVHDEHGMHLGFVEGVGDNGAQPLLWIRNGQERFHVPAVPEFLIKVTSDDIIVNVPEGLLEAVKERVPQ